MENKPTKQRIDEDRAPVFSIPETTRCTEHPGKIFLSMYMTIISYLFKRESYATLEC